MSEPNYAKLEASNPHLDKEKPYPLAGILVVDFTHVLSGPTCTRMLADAGARVIHIERKTGDDTRHMGHTLRMVQVNILESVMLVKNQLP